MNPRPTLVVATAGSDVARLDVPVVAVGCDLAGADIILAVNSDADTWVTEALSQLSASIPSGTHVAVSPGARSGRCKHRRWKR